MLATYRTRFDQILAPWKHPVDLSRSATGVPSPKYSDPEKGVAIIVQELRREREKNKVLQAQVVSLEGIIEDLRSQIEQYNSEAISNAKRIMDLENVVEESQKKSQGLISAKSLEAAIDKVVELEERLKIQTDFVSGVVPSAPEDEFAYMAVENAALRDRVQDLEHNLAYDLKIKSIAPEEELACALIEAAVYREKAAESSPVFSETAVEFNSSVLSDELASSLVEASVLRTSLAEAQSAANKAKDAISRIRKEAFAAVELTKKEIDNIRKSDAFAESLASGKKEESFKSLVIPEMVEPSIVVPTPMFKESPTSSVFAMELDEQLAYSLVEYQRNVY